MTMPMWSRCSALASTGRITRESHPTAWKRQAWTQKFVRWYNQENKRSGLKFVTPAQRHTGQTAIILADRERLYAAAKSSNPRQWSGRAGNWQLQDEVWLSLERSQAERLKQAA